MEKGEKFQREEIRTVPRSVRQNLDSSLRSEIGKPKYINENCWLVKALNYAPYKRCRYCEFKFRNCLFLHYQTISLILILVLFTISFLIEGKISELMIISVFTLVIVYGYFFNKSTEKIIKAVFAQRKAKEALEKLAEGLESQVEQRTKELKKAYEDLKKLDKAKSEFISIASHQLRTPLSIIKGYISMMLEGTYGALPPKIEKILKNINVSNERLIKLINDLLDVSRIEAGKMEMNSKKTSLTEIISSVINELKIRSEEKNIYLKYDKPTKRLPQILLDQDKIRQAILNIIDNAIRYTNRGGVTVKLEIENYKLKIVITDTGEGVTEAESASLFESFSRGTAGIRLSTEGVGLGLYTAKKFIEMHQGRIWVESEGKDKGSTFYIELPIK